MKKQMIQSAEEMTKDELMQREKSLRHIIDGLFLIAEPGPVKNSLWAAYQELGKKKRIMSSRNGQELFLEENTNKKG